MYLWLIIAWLHSKATVVKHTVAHAFFEFFLALQFKLSSLRLSGRVDDQTTGILNASVRAVFSWEYMYLLAVISEIHDFQIILVLLIFCTRYNML